MVNWPEITFLPDLLKYLYKIERNLKIFRFHPPLPVPLVSLLSDFVYIH